MLFEGGGVFELAGKTLGIVGLGRIGRELAKRARAFDLRVLYTDIVRADDADAEFRELDQLLSESDIVSLHAPLSPETKHLINEETIGRMKAGAPGTGSDKGHEPLEAARVTGALASV